MSDSRIIPDHYLDHANTKSVDNNFHSTVGSNMSTSQSNSSFGFNKSEGDVPLCKSLHLTHGTACCNITEPSYESEYMAK